MKIRLILNCILILCFGCKKTENNLLIINDGNNYDIILLAGQSNTLFGFPKSDSIDLMSPLIKQLGRFKNNLKIVPALEPLDNWSKYPNHMGFSSEFANEYIKLNLLDSGRYLLIIPCGMGSTGFKHNDWNKGSYLYQDAINRVNIILKSNSKNKLVAFLWHQGEADVGWSYYQTELDKMINGMRLDILDNKGKDIPFILGGMVPYWVDQDSARNRQQNIIANTVYRIHNTGFANPYLPYRLTKDNDNDDIVHYNAKQLRELGKRYFSEYLKIINNL